MRTSAITVFAKNVPPLSRRGKAAGLAATVLLAGGVQLLGTDSAWACGGPEETGAPAVTAPTEHHGGTVSTFSAPVPNSITAGGGKIEVDITTVNNTGAGYDRFTPMLSINAADPSRGEVRTDDLTVEVRRADGSWKALPVVRYCDPGNWADTGSLAERLPDGGSTRFRFRIGLSAGTDRAVTRLSIFGDTTADGRTDSLTLPIKRAAAPQSPTHSPSPSPSPTPTPTPTATATATPTTTPTAAPTASTAAPIASGSPEATPTLTAAPAALARTGGSRSTGPLIGAGGALVLLGTGGVLIARRRARR